VVKIPSENSRICEQTVFKNTLKGSLTMIEHDLSLGCKDGSTCKSVNVICHINKIKDNIWSSQ
jgi:hypothetical protein